jgi:hypothetical protein
MASKRKILLRIVILENEESRSEFSTYITNGSFSFSKNNAINIITTGIASAGIIVEQWLVCGAFGMVCENLVFRFLNDFDPDLMIPSVENLWYLLRAKKTNLKHGWNC